jgi:hypothetical protein
LPQPYVGAAEPENLACALTGLGGQPGANLKKGRMFKSTGQFGIVMRMALTALGAVASSYQLDAEAAHANRLF